MKKITILLLIMVAIMLVAGCETTERARIADIDPIDVVMNSTPFRVTNDIDISLADAVNQFIENPQWSFTQATNSESGDVTVSGLSHSGEKIEIRAIVSVHADGTVQNTIRGMSINEVSMGGQNDVRALLLQMFEAYNSNIEFLGWGHGAFDDTLDTTTESQQLELPPEEDGEPAEPPSQPTGPAIMYNIPSFYFASQVPDFLALVTNGESITNEGNTDIFADGGLVMLTYDLGFISVEVMDEYRELLRSAGFVLEPTTFAEFESWGTDNISFSIEFLRGGAMTFFINSLDSMDYVLYAGACGPDDDDLYWYHQPSTPFFPIDTNLVGGRWVSDTGTRIELFGDGTGTTTMNLWEWPFSGNEIQWFVDDGRLILFAEHVRQCTNMISFNGQRSRYELRVTNVPEVYARTEGVDENNLYGLWMPTTSGGGGIRFNRDGTGHDYISRLGHFTWHLHDGVVTRVYQQGWMFDYLASGNQLTLFGTDGSTVYTRIGGN